MVGTILNMTPEELDQHIYRIMPEAYVVALFKDQQNTLSQVHNWKDKFENFQLKIGGVLDGEPFEFTFKNDFVGQCWTRESLSEAMWGIYANDSTKRYVRIRSTPRKLLTALADAHPEMPQDTCFIGNVQYLKEAELKAHVHNGGQLELSSRGFAENLLLKRHAFQHESEVRLIYFGKADQYDAKGLYRYAAAPHSMITQIMADPNRDRTNWLGDKKRLQATTGFAGPIKRSKIYDPPDWSPPKFTS